MSISSSLSNAVSGMNTAARMAEVVSSNVANSLTDGYGRRSLDGPSSVVVRHIDRGVLADRRLAEAGLRNSESLVSTMGQVEDIVGRVGEIGSISSRIVDVEAALIGAATDPSSTTRLSNLSNRLTDLTSSLNLASREIQALRAEADTSIAAQISQLNTSLKQLEQLNGDIVSASATGIDNSALMDQRQLVVDKIAQIVPVRELDRENGRIALMTPTGEMLIDGQAKEFEFTGNPVIVADMTLASGGLSGISVDGAPVASDGIGRLAGGTLGAAFQARDVELVSAQAGLDTIAADLITRFQDPNVDPSLIPGQAGLFTDGGAPYDPLNVTGVASRISLNSSVDPAQGGILTNLRDGVAAGIPGPSGNAALLQSFSTALAVSLSSGSDASLQSAAGRASGFEAQIGNQRLNFEAEMSFSNARWSGLKEAEIAGGVDTDFEMQMLLRVEQAYAANARVVQTINTLMQRLMEI